jgi:hypothetical protein
MISLSKGQSIKDFMIEETKSKLTQRYKLSHYAEDIGVSYCSIWRFTNGKAVNEQFYLKWWKNYLKKLITFRQSYGCLCLFLLP